MDDKELFQSAMADEPRQETPASAPEPQATEQPRDDQGRFAPKQETTTEAAPIQPQTPAEQTPATLTEVKDDPGGQVPSWRLREVNEGRAADRLRAEEAIRQSAVLQQQLQQMHSELSELRKPKEEPADVFQNPDAWHQQQMSPILAKLEQIEQDRLSERLDNKREIAVIKHGEELVAEMERAVTQAKAENHPDIPALVQRMRVASNPVEVALQWHRQNKLMAETGGDLKAYDEKVIQKAMKDPARQAQWHENTRATAGQTQQPNARPNIQLPPSLNKAPGAGLSNTPDDGDMSDRSLFKYAMSSPRR